MTSTPPADAMALSDAAKANYGQLFPGRAATLAQTDPELMAFFGNWAFGEVLRDAAELDDGLDLRTRLPLPYQAAAGQETRLEVGKTVQERIVGAGRVDQMHAGAPEDAKQFQRYLTGNCFGDVVARNGLDLATRELLTFAMLAGLGGADAQLRGHISGSLNVGNTRTRLLTVLIVITPFIGYSRALNALAAINDIAKP